MFTTEINMTPQEWNAGVDYLTDAEMGDWVSYQNRKIAVENMSGGKYLCHRDGEVVRLVETVAEAMLFLAGGR